MTMSQNEDLQDGPLIKSEGPNDTIPVPNSAPHQTGQLEDDTYTYRDFGTIPAPTIGGAVLVPHPQSLQAQKLPAKLASMLADPDLASVILWLTHGRSWRVLNRDLFAEHALPRYFGHKNYASFVRIVNAWGFRRITRGPDRDSYYHELFLRGRPDLHQRMKRLSTCHRKTPVSKEDKAPDFYELAKTSPLPEVQMQRPTSAGAGSAGGMMNNQQGVMNHQQAPSAQGNQLSPFSALRGATAGVAPGAGNMSAGSGQMGNFNDQMLSLLAQNDAARSMNISNSMNPAAGLASMAAGGGDANANLPRLAQLQRDNEELRRRIMEMENKQQVAAGQQNQMGRSPDHLRNPQQQMIPDQFAALSANLNIGVNNSNVKMESLQQGGAGGNNDLLDLQRLQQNFMMRSNGAPTMNNTMNNTFLNSLAGAGAPMNGNGAVGNGGTREFSFMTNFPREDQLLRAMRLENQMGFSSSQQGSQSTLERALQSQQSINSGVTSTGSTSTGGASGPQGSDDDQMKKMLDLLTKQQHQTQQL